MILDIIGIVLGVIAICLFFWLKKEQQMNFDLHDGDIEASKHAYNALMEDFTNYEVRTDREIRKISNNVEIKRIKNEKDIGKIKKDLPSIIRRVIGHIEFAKPLDKK